MPPTPFQAWLDIVRAERGWTVHDRCAPASWPRATRGPAAGRAPLARQRRIKPLGVALTMYHTRWLPEEYLDRLWAIASARGTSLETALRDALRIALPRMEPRARR